MENLDKMLPENYLQNAVEDPTRTTQKLPKTSKKAIKLFEKTSLQNATSTLD